MPIIAIDTGLGGRCSYFFRHDFAFGISGPDRKLGPEFTTKWSLGVSFQPSSCGTCLPGRLKISAIFVPPVDEANTRLRPSKLFGSSCCDSPPEGFVTIMPDDTRGAGPAVQDFFLLFISFPFDYLSFLERAIRRAHLF